jgi:hypothetical protein
MNWEMVKGVVERIATIAVTYLVAKGIVPTGVAENIVTLVVLGGSVIWGVVVNRPTALAAAADATAPK